MKTKRSNYPGQLALGLFCLYTLFYGIFVSLSVASPETLEIRWGGINLAVLYGMALIVAAIGCATVYNAYGPGEAENPAP